MVYFGFKIWVLIFLAFGSLIEHLVEFRFNFGNLNSFFFLCNCFLFCNSVQVSLCDIVASSFERFLL